MIKKEREPREQKHTGNQLVLISHKDCVNNQNQCEDSHLPILSLIIERQLSITDQRGEAFEYIFIFQIWSEMKLTILAYLQYDAVSVLTSAAPNCSENSHSATPLSASAPSHHHNWPPEHP